MDQIIAVFNYGLAGVDLPPTNLKLTGYYDPKDFDFDIEDLEDRFVVNLEEKTVEVLTTLEKLQEFSFLILLEQIKTRLADWWKDHYIQVNAYFHRAEMLMIKTQVIVVFGFEYAGVDLPPEGLKMTGYYIPQEFDLKGLKNGVDINLEKRTVEILTTLKMLHKFCFPSLEEQVKKGTAVWWKNHSNQVNAYYKENYWLNMSLYRAMRGE